MSTQAPRVTGVRVDATGIGKRYGAALALADVTVTIQPGEIHALVGENGAGKSTLGKIIAGAVRARRRASCSSTAGRSRYSSPRDAIRHGIAIIEPGVRARSRRCRCSTTSSSASSSAPRGLLDRARGNASATPSSPSAIDFAPRSVDCGSARCAPRDQQKVEIMRAARRATRA